MPACVYGVTVPNEDGTFDVYINCDVCQAKQRATLRHELCHIRRNHFYDSEPVVVNELSACTDSAQELLPDVY